MNSNTIVFEVSSILEMTFDEDSDRVERVSRFAFEVSENIKREVFFSKNENGEERMTKEACEATTKTLVSAIAGNIHYAHQKGMIDSAEHLREVISELEKLFIQNARMKLSKIKEGEFTDFEDVR